MEKEEFFLWCERNVRTLVMLVVVLFFSTFYVWQVLFAGGGSGASDIFFLDVGQGDASFVRSGRVDVLIDGGPSSQLVSQLERVMPLSDRYIDLVFISHPQEDHIGGLIELVQRYDVGALLWNGDGADIAAFSELMERVRAAGIPIVTLRRGDTVTVGEGVYSVLWPTQSPHEDLNERSLVLRYTSPDISALFTGDIGSDIERMVARDVGGVDVLKVAHHGSRFSSSRNFLSSVDPRIAVISVGENWYGHPTSETLERLRDAGAFVARTDLNGLVHIFNDDGILRVYGKKESPRARGL